MKKIVVFAAALACTLLFSSCATLQTLTNMMTSTESAPEAQSGLSGEQANDTVASESHNDKTPVQTTASTQQAVTTVTPSTTAAENSSAAPSVTAATQTTRATKARTTADVRTTTKVPVTTVKNISTTAKAIVTTTKKPVSTTKKSTTTTKKVTTTAKMTTTAKKTTTTKKITTTKKATTTAKKSITVNGSLTFARNSNATLSITAAPNTRYTITVYYSSGPSKAKGLEPQQSDSAGNVSWSWKIGNNTKPGEYRVVITGGNETITKYITVQ